MLVYVAGPYTAGKPLDNVIRAIKAGEELRKLGYTPFIPHLFHFWHLVFPHKYDFWATLDMEFLAKCDLIYRLSGESSGADAEMQYAKEHGIPELKVDLTQPL